MARSRSKWGIRTAAVLATTFITGALGDEILSTESFTNCDSDSSISVQKADITYNNDNKTVVFDVAGTSDKQQNVTAMLNVTAYGESVYSYSFNPCEAATYVSQLCPVPVGSFSAQGSQQIPSSYASQIPSLAFSVPDIDASATLQLKTADGSDAGCVTSTVTNGKTASIPAVSYLLAGIAGVALIASGVSAAISATSAGASGSAPGGATVSPSFTEIFGVFQGFAMNGMFSVNYPEVYRSFVKNYAFSTGIIPWNSLQVSIDNFREATGGNLTDDSVQFLKNATLVFGDNSTMDTDGSILRRGFDGLLVLRDISTSVNSTSTSGDDSSSTESTVRAAVTGIQAYVEELRVPQANTFMTLLLIVAIVIGLIVVGILLVKVILEAWALFGKFPDGLTGFRKHYWQSIGRMITQLILLLYGVWVLYCVYQFAAGDSWAAKALAAFTLVVFTGLLAFFSYKIYATAQKLKKAEGDASALYDDKSIWMKYNMFYESYQKDFWWLFVPAIAYAFAKGFVIAAADGHGMVQTIAEIVIEGLMLILLLWTRPFERKSGNWVNISIQVVRVLSVVCILVFVDELGLAETTKTVTGVVLIAVQAGLSGILAILIGWNAIVSCVKQNPHRKRRKEMEKMQRDMDTLTPLDARNSLLMERSKTPESTGKLNDFSSDVKQPLARNQSPDRSNPYANQSTDNLITNAAAPGRQPTVPNVEGGFTYGQERSYSNGYYRAPQRPRY